jgi:hypothetical protein
MFGGFNPHTFNANGAEGTTGGLDTPQSEGSPFLQCPTDLDGLEFGFPFNMDMSNMGGDMNGLMETEHSGFLPS